jgi:hypothetical protein
MIPSHPPYDEEEAIKAILAHHQLPITPKLVSHLGQLLVWVREDQKHKDWPNHTPPPFLLVLLGSMGIYKEKKTQPKPHVVQFREPTI